VKNKSLCMPQLFRCANEIDVPQFISFSLAMFLLWLSPAWAEPIDIGQNPAISECGGFNAQPDKSQPRGRTPQATELLKWRYDPGTKVVTFVNTNVMLNCCGDHAISVFFDEQMKVYIINELDQPKDGGSRCRCQCAYDFKIDLPDIQQDRILIALYRNVTDQGGRQNLFLGSLDLSRKQGTVKLRSK
jgi:hypothetical protein